MMGSVNMGDNNSKAAARVKSYEQRFKESGGRVIHKLRLKPDAAQALAQLEALGWGSPTAIINQLIVSEAARHEAANSN